MGAAMRRIQAGNALSAFGIGFTVPYLYVYVAQVRGLGARRPRVRLAAFAVAVLWSCCPSPVGSSTGAVPCPWSSVRPSPRRSGALALGLVGGDRAGRCCRPLALGAGQAVMQPALATMIVWCSTPAPARAPSPLQFFLQNLGLGIGGLIGG